MNYEISLVLIFIAWVEFLSLLAFPVCFKIFMNLTDRGYAFSKTLSLLFFSYLSFIALSSGLSKYFFIRMIPSLFFAILCIVVTIRYFRELKLFFMNSWKIILVTEALFLGSFALATFIKMGNAAIWATEKLPDFGLYNRLTLESSLPPKDIWLSGFPVNYYYVGHFVFATLTKITGIPAVYGVNLSVILIFCLIFISSFSIIYNLSGKTYSSLICAFGTSFLGHLDGTLQILQNGFGKFNWWRSTRVIDGTINEFPFFAFLLGDLHAHYISLPFLLLFLGTALNLSLKTKSSDLMKESHFLGFDFYFPAVLSTGFIATTNPWFLPVLFGVLVLILFDFYGLATRRNFTTFFRIAINFIAVLFLSTIFFFPFFLEYDSPVSGIGLLPLSLASTISQYLIVFGFPLLIIGIYLANELKKYRSKNLIFFSIVSFGLALVLYAVRPKLVIPILFLFLIFQVYNLLREKFHDFPMILSLLAFMILLGTEIFYIEDIYAFAFKRMNTVFKFHWIALTMLLLITPYLAIKILDRLNGRILKTSFLSLFILLFLASTVYSAFATWKRNFTYGIVPAYLTLDGSRYIRNSYPDEYAAMAWIRKNTDKNDIILEATGKPFYYYSRFSSFTGRPTVLGWANHEWVWRKDISPETESRTIDIEKIYSEPDKAKVIDLVRKYGVKYIIVGLEERSDFKSNSLTGFKQYFKVAMSSNSVEIYRTEW
jgi:YYY domain-containing protein